jgi:hypothetical protein
MAITAADVITRATDLIQDQTNVRWPVEELMRYLNDGRREICIVRPDIYATTSVVTLAAGTKQAVPADGRRLLDVVRNIAVDGVTPGRAIRIVEREVLDAQRPNWHTEAAGAVRHFMFDERTPREFFVYPPASATTKVQLSYSKTPVEIVDPNTELSDEDIYTSALVDYVCYRAFSKDAEYAGNTERAALHYSQFMSSLGVGKKASYVTSPNMSNVGGVVPRTAQADAQ